MHSALGVKTLLAVLLVVPVGLPRTLSADEQRPAGAALIALADLPSRDVWPLKTQVHLTERIDVDDRIFARLLFGGRVMIVARAGARLRITEVAGASTIEVQQGRVAVTVDRQKLHSEDLVELRTPHAVVTVPSSTVIVEVAEASSFTTIGRPVEVFRLDPVTGAAREPPPVAAANRRGCRAACSPIAELLAGRVRQAVARWLEPDRSSTSSR